MTIKVLLDCQQSDFLYRSTQWGESSWKLNVGETFPYIPVNSFLILADIYQIPQKTVPCHLFTVWNKPLKLHIITDGNPGGFCCCSEVLMWVWSVRSSPSVRQRRRDRSRIHRSLWPSHPASAYPRCLHITQQDRERLMKKGKQRERERQSEAKATQRYTVRAPYDVRATGAGWGESGSLFRSTASSSSYHHHPPTPPHPPHTDTRRWGQERSAGGGAKRGGGRASSSRLGHKHTHQLLNEASLSLYLEEFIQSSLFKVWSRSFL